MNTELVSLLDVVPTALDWLNISYPQYHILNQYGIVNLTGQSILNKLQTGRNTANMINNENDSTENVRKIVTDILNMIYHPLNNRLFSFHTVLTFLCLIEIKLFLF